MHLLPFPLFSAGPAVAAASQSARLINSCGYLCPLWALMTRAAKGKEEQTRGEGGVGRQSAIVSRTVDEVGLSHLAAALCAEAARFSGPRVSRSLILRL